MRIKGWKEVFRFSFTQQVKTKSFIIGTIVIALIVAIMTFLADFLPAVLLADELDKVNRSAEGEDVFSVDTLYISNESGYDLDFSSVFAENMVTIKNITAEEADAKTAEIADTTEKAVVTKITLDENGFSVDTRYAGGKAAIAKSDVEALNSVMTDTVKKQYLMKLGVAEADLGLAMSNVRSSFSSAGEEPVSFIKQMLNTIVPMISSIVLFVFIFSYSQMVAQSIAIEKSSRVIEYLLTSIKPLAIILGKVLAMCCVSLMQFILIGLGGVVGFVASLPFGIITKIGPMLGSAAEQMQTSDAGAEAAEIVGGITDAFSGIDASLFIIMLLTFILGFLFFAGIAGLAGASVSKMEDLSSAIQPLSLIGVLGFYLAYFPQVTGEENTMSAVARYLPISSPFILPSDYLLGRIDLPGALLAIAILAAADIVIMMIVAKVYEGVILHTGNRLKFSDMLKMSK